MATGIQGTVTGAATLTYTPLSEAKVLISVSGTAGSITINGASLAMPATLVQLTLYVGSGQTLTITTVASMTAQVSSLES